ncbi:hypothetical protein C8D90_101875 [Enterobacillus tribolii]|uniref:Uncharacterized protein n=1 Tax=Enterobacillus tribolii TaxID=1487935 RepID=A0A370R5N1_9GAMM|nr:hypothetical protein C8D90_101875 [Enterobacillus tribolii]
MKALTVFDPAYVVQMSIKFWLISLLMCSG